jgi:hypothetical protein
MTRYVTKSARWSYALDDDVLLPETMTVIEEDAGPKYTGLLDASGNPIYRVPDDKVFGFGR